MRAICGLLIASLLFSGCAQYYPRIGGVAGRPIDLVGRGDFVRLQLVDGTKMTGTVSQVEDDYLVVSGTVIPWTDVQTLETKETSHFDAIEIVVLIGMVLVLVGIGHGLREIIGPN